MQNKLRKYINKKFRLYPKTKEILEVREELFSIVVDKYNDCIQSGMDEDRSYREAIEMMVDYKEAVREVETGSSLSALKRNVISVAAFSTFYFVMLTAVYLFVSMVVLNTFEHTWLIAVGGAFIYLVYFSMKAYQYAALFNLNVLTRCGIGLIYLCLIPLFYVFPSLYVSVMGYPSIWGQSWLIVILILLFYILTDYIVYRKQVSLIQRGLHLIAAGLVLTTVLYLVASLYFHLWSTAWILYVVYLAAISLAFYICEKTGKEVTK
jgi:hypothetical protein